MHDGVHHRRHCAYAAGFACTLRPERVAFRWHRVRHDPHVAQVVGARHAVIHEAGRQQLAGIRFVDHLLHQNLTNALRHTTMDLSCQSERIDHGADVIDHEIRLQIDHAGVRINFKLADMAPIRERVERRRIGGVLVEARPHAFG